MNSAMRTFLVHSDEATKYADLLPANSGRQSKIDSLVFGYNLHKLCEVSHIIPAPESHFWAFHDKDYVRHVLQAETWGTQDSDSEESPNNLIENPESLMATECPKATDKSKSPDSERQAHNLSQNHRYGLVDDCPVFTGLNGYLRAIVGSSDSTVRCLQQETEEPKIVLNWYGGRHHAGKARASGYCYINDVVLTIVRCRVSHKKVFYLDLDLHHGDGVEQAFRFSKNVTTLSIHRFDTGFFPGTGKSSSPGSYNVPVRRGLSDATLAVMIEQVISFLQRKSPDLVVIQCGCDGLAGDPCGEWNLSIRGLATAVKQVVDSANTDCVLVAGGGYNSQDAAKYYAYLTKIIVGDSSDWNELPESATDFEGYRFWTNLSMQGKPFRKDENNPQELKRLIESME